MYLVSLWITVSYVSYFHTKHRAEELADDIQNTSEINPEESTGESGNCNFILLSVVSPDVAASERIYVITQTLTIIK